MTRVCKKCGIEKELEEFELDSRKKYGRTNRCRDCAREYKRLNAIKHHDRRLEELRKWREANPEEYKARKHAEYLRHKDKYNASSKRWYQENKELVREQGKRWRAENKEWKAERDRAYRLNNPERCKAIQRKWYKDNKEYADNKNNLYCIKRRREDEGFNIIHRLRSRVRSAIKDNSKSDRTENLLGCTVEFLRGWLEAQFTDGMTWEAFLDGKIHIDHIRPCASFDLTDPIQQRICFNYRNLQPLWAVDNMQKHNKWDSSDENIWANKPINDLLVEIQHIQYIV